MIILTLDLGVTTGVAIGNDKELFMSGTKKFTNTLKMPAIGHMGDSRYLDFTEWLWKITREFIQSDNQLLIVSEKTNKHMPGYNGVRLHFGLQAMLDELQAEYPSSIEVQRVSATSIKKFWTGSGKASKEQMVAKAQEKHPEVTDDNEADAVALYYHTLDNLYK